MERRVALAMAGAVTSTLLAGTVAFAAAGGASILGFGSSGSPAAGAPRVVTQVETISDMVVVVSTTPTSLPGATDTTVDPVSPDLTVAPTTISPRSEAYSLGPVVDDAATTTTSITTTTIPSTKWPTAPIGGNDDDDDAAPRSPSAAPATTAPAAPAAPAAVTTVAATTPPVTTAPATTTIPVSATTVAATVATTTTVAATTTTRPPGVPANWPASKPIPPMPAGCKNGQLEDNGVWNCQH